MCAHVLVCVCACVHACKRASEHVCTEQRRERVVCATCRASSRLCLDPSDFLPICLIFSAYYCLILKCWDLPSQVSTGGMGLDPARLGYLFWLCVHTQYMPLYLGLGCEPTHAKLRSRAVGACTRTHAHAHASRHAGTPNPSHATCRCRQRCGADVDSDVAQMWTVMPCRCGQRCCADVDSDAAQMWTAMLRRCGQ